MAAAVAVGGAAPPAPVLVVVALPAPAGTASVLSLLASEPLVIATPALPWALQPSVGGAPPRVHLPLHTALRFFLRRCKCGPLPADLAMFSRLDIFELGLSAPTWSRVLSELVASGLLAGPLVFFLIQKNPY